MPFTPLTEEQYNKAIESGYKPEQIIEFERQRKQEESGGEDTPIFTEANIPEPAKVVEDKPQVQHQNILGALLNVPGATSRAAIQSNPKLAFSGPLAGLIALSGVAGKETQQAAGLGAARPDNVPNFQKQALDKYYDLVSDSASNIPNDSLRNAAIAGSAGTGMAVSAGGLAADMATDPTNILISLIGGLKPIKVKPVSEAIDKPFMKAVNPGTRGIKKYSDINKTKINARSAVESIVDNKDNLQFTDELGNIVKGRLPENLDEFSQAISQTKKSVFSKYDALMKDAGEKGATVPLRPIADEILTAISHPQVEDLSPTVQNYGMQLADRLQKRGTYSLTEAQDAIEALNNRLKSYFNNPTPEALHQSVIDRAVVNNLRNSLVKAVEGKSGGSYDVLRRQYGHLNAIEESVTRSAIRNSGDRMGSFASIFDTLSSGDILNGLVNLNPGMVAKGGVQIAARRIHSALNSPNKNIRNMFNNVDRIKNIEPAKMKLRAMLKSVTGPLIIQNSKSIGKDDQ